MLKNPGYSEIFVNTVVSCVFPFSKTNLMSFCGSQVVDIYVRVQDRYLDDILNFMEIKMFIRKYKATDCKEIIDLFYNTVHNVNVKDYTKEQLAVWATEQVDLEKWNESLLEHYSLVAVDNGIIVGFGDIDKDGYLDRLFVHVDYQRKGIATAICNELERIVEGDITTRASITAKPFFKKRGYKVVKQQEVERQGIFLTNFCMVKKI